MAEEENVDHGDKKEGGGAFFRLIGGREPEPIESVDAEQRDRAHRRPWAPKGQADLGGGEARQVKEEADVAVHGAGQQHRREQAANKSQQSDGGGIIKDGRCRRQRDGRSQKVAAVVGRQQRRIKKTEGRISRQVERGDARRGADVPKDAPPLAVKGESTGARGRRRSSDRCRRGPTR